MAAVARRPRRARSLRRSRERLQCAVVDKRTSRLGSNLFWSARNFEPCRSFEKQVISTSQAVTLKRRALFLPQLKDKARHSERGPGIRRDTSKANFAGSFDSAALRSG